MIVDKKTPPAPEGNSATRGWVSSILGPGHSCLRLHLLWPLDSILTCRRPGTGPGCLLRTRLQRTWMRNRVRRRQNVNLKTMMIQRTQT